VSAPPFLESPPDFHLTQLESPGVFTALKAAFLTSFTGFDLELPHTVSRCSCPTTHNLSLSERYAPSFALPWARETTACLPNTPTPQPTTRKHRIFRPILSLYCPPLQCPPRSVWPASNLSSSRGTTPSVKHQNVTERPPGIYYT
jgi:hypothetical protein